MDVINGDTNYLSHLRDQSFTFSTPFPLHTLVITADHFANHHSGLDVSLYYCYT